MGITRPAAAHFQTSRPGAVAWTLYGLVASQLGDVHDEFITQEGGTRVEVGTFIYECAPIKPTEMPYVLRRTDLLL